MTSEAESLRAEIEALRRELEELRKLRSESLGSSITELAMRKDHELSSGLEAKIEKCIDVILKWGKCTGL